MNQTKTLFVKEMEQHFYRDEFEQMLKDTTEDFRMYPSRKIWHSIYNDLHPDRKWPSFAVCLLLIASILYIGVSNNNSISKNAKSMVVVGKSTPLFVIAQNGENVIANISGPAALTPSPKVDITPASNVRCKASLSDVPTAALESGVATEATITTSDRYNVEHTGPASTLLANNHELPAPDLQTPSLPGLSNPAAGTNDLEGLVPGPGVTNIRITRLVGKILPISVSKNLSKISTAEKGDRSKTTIDLPTISWIEDFAFHNTVNKKKWKTNTSFQYYVTPSFGYRTLEKNNDFEPTTGPLLRTNDNEAVTQQAAPGFEAGVQLLVAVSKKLRFRMGLQYNYTNYITYAHELQHPSQATVLMNDMNNRFVIPVSYSSNHANVLGSNFNRLNNTTNQISIPLGFDYKLAGNHKIRWHVGSTIQPSFVASGNAFLISQDSKNFVEDATLLRNFNLNTSFETFVSFKTPSGIDINVGPQLRYQLLSTHQKEYTYTEKLYNLGLKIGLTKKL